MRINVALSVRRLLLAAVVGGATCLAMMACGSVSTELAAATETVLHTFVGRFAEQPDVEVALLVGRDASMAYVCDNHGGAELLRGSARQHGPDGTVELTSAGGTRLDATFGARDAGGTVTLPGQPAVRFTALLATGAAGLYEASAAVAHGRLQGRWIAGNDGQVAGVAKLNGVSVGNPALQPTVRVGAGTLIPLPVLHLPATQPRQRPPGPPGPVIDSAFSLRCGDFHVGGSGFTPGAPVRVFLMPAVSGLAIQVSDVTVFPYRDGTIAADLAYRLSSRPLDDGDNVQVAALESGHTATLNAHAC